MPLSYARGVLENTKLPSGPDKAALENGLAEIARKYGDWSYDVPLPHGLWTMGNLGIPHTRLKRVVQIVADLVGKPLSSCRILDLGCLNGQFTVEFALQGASAVGIEFREANIEKARFLKWALGLDNVEFVQGDARDISTARHGRFDAIICSGLLYHLTAADAIDLIRTMYDMAERAVVIDTHIALSPDETVALGGRTFAGRTFVEHSENATQEEKTKSNWASADNVTSFWFTRESLVNAISEAGFSSVYECFTPAHLNYGSPGLEHRDRCTFACVKGREVELATSPKANGIRESWPEGGLSYAPPLSRLQRLVGKLL
ncbi:MAG TPA: class I SAM-dependent methyltransferase [Allosphingosinicella sp.]